MEEKETKEVVKQKKKVNILAIAVCILSLLTLGMGIYIGYTKASIKEAKNKVIDVEEEIDETPEILDIYSEQIQNLYDKIHTFRNCISDTTSLYKNGTVSIGNFKSLAFYMAYEILAEEKGVYESQDISELSSFTYDDINKKAKNIFGTDFNIEDKEYSLCSYKYDSTTKTYSYNMEGGCGCTTGPEEPQITLYKAEKIGDEINIYNAVIYKKYNEGSIYYTYYKDPLYNQKITDNACYEGYSTKDCIDNSTRYKFIFTKEDDNYILSNITKAN